MSCAHASRSPVVADLVALIMCVCVCGARDALECTKFVRACAPASEHDMEQIAYRCGSMIDGSIFNEQLHTRSLAYTEIDDCFIGDQRCEDCSENSERSIYQPLCGWCACVCGMCKCWVKRSLCTDWSRHLKHREISWKPIFNRFFR